MALRWKPTIPADNNPYDVVGSLHLHVFARVYRVQSGSDQGRFRWYLNDVPESAGVRLQGMEDTQRKAQQAANLQFPAMAQAGGSQGSTYKSQEAARPALTARLCAQGFRPEAEGAVLVCSR